MLDWFDIVPMIQLISLASLGFDLKVDFIFLLVQKNEAKKARPWQLANLHFAEWQTENF